MDLERLVMKVLYEKILSAPEFNISAAEYEKAILESTRQSEKIIMERARKAANKPFAKLINKFKGSGGKFLNGSVGVLLILLLSSTASSEEQQNKAYRLYDCPSLFFKKVNPNVLVEIEKNDKTLTAALVELSDALELLNELSAQEIQELISTQTQEQEIEEKMFDFGNMDKEQIKQIEQNMYDIEKQLSTLNLTNA